MKKKSIKLIALSLVLVVALVGCGNKEKTATDGNVSKTIFF